MARDRERDLIETELLADDDEPRSRGRLGLLTGVAGVTAAVVAPVAAGIAYSRYGVDHDMRLPAAIDAERRTFRSPMAGDVSYYMDEAGRERPLALIHSVNAGASAYEMRPLFEYYRGRRPVYALDLPGFGFSERADRVYTPAMYAVALMDFLREIGAGMRGGADVVALSLGCEFAARAAIERPELIHSLALISPSGMTTPQQINATQRAGEQPAGQALYRALSVPLWSQAIYDALASRASLRYFLARSFVGEPDPGLVEYAYATTHRPGARYAPLYFVSGRLFTPNAIETLYARVSQPAQVIYDRDAYVRFDALPQLLRDHSNWSATRLAPSRGLPQFERLGDTARTLNGFWSEAVAALS